MDTYKRFFVFILCIIYTPLFCRSLLRPKDTSLPRLTARWADDTGQSYSITDSHIEAYPLFVVYNETYFNRYRLPLTDISFRYDQSKNITGAYIDQLIERLLCEIKSGKKRYTDFILLQDKDFNHKKAAGLAVFRFKNYPFVLKLFIETPESFVRPWIKGILPVLFFHMGGGTNRHITGLTRIQNMHIIRKRLKEIPKWADFVDTPRKWFWIPEKARFIELIGTNIGGKKELTALVPGTYAIIADAIQASEEKTIFDRHKRKIALELCNTLDLFIDPHIDNFMMEKGTHKLVIIDTEHFPTLVGLKEKVSYKTYVRWYLGLMGKASFDIFFRNKKERKKAQTTVSHLNLFDELNPKCLVQQSSSFEQINYPALSSVQS